MIVNPAISNITTEPRMASHTTIDKSTTTTDLEDTYEIIILFMGLLVIFMGFSLVAFFVCICFRRWYEPPKTSSTNTYFNIKYSDDSFVTTSTQTSITYFNRVFKPRVLTEEDESKRNCDENSATLEKQQDKKNAKNDAESVEDAVEWEWNTPLEVQGNTTKKSDEALADETTLVTVELHPEEGGKFSEAATAAVELQGEKTNVTDETSASEITQGTVQLHPEKGEKFAEAATAAVELQGDKTKVTDETSAAVAGTAVVEMVAMKEGADEASVASTAF